MYRLPRAIYMIGVSKKNSIRRIMSWNIITSISYSILLFYIEWNLFGLFNNLNEANYICMLYTSVQVFMFVSIMLLELEIQMEPIWLNHISSESDLFVVVSLSCRVHTHLQWSWLESKENNWHASFSISALDLHLWLIAECNPNLHKVVCSFVYNTTALRTIVPPRNQPKSGMYLEHPSEDSPP